MTRYRIIRRTVAASESHWYHPQRRYGWTWLSVWLPLSMVGECTRDAAQRLIDLDKGVITPPRDRVVHEETAP